MQLLIDSFIILFWILSIFIPEHNECVVIGKRKR